MAKEGSTMAFFSKNSLSTGVWARELIYDSNLRR